MGGYRQLPITPYQSEAQSPLDAYGKVLNLQNLVRMQKLLPGQLQEQQQQITAGGQENQLRAQQITDQKAMTNAMQEWDGKDYNALPGLVLKHGGSANTVMSLKTGIIKQQTDLANLSKDQLANEKTKNDALLGLLDGVKDPNSFEQAKQTAVQRGYTDPQTASQFSFDHLDVIKKSLMGHSAQVEDAAKQAEIQKNTAQAGEAQAQTTKLQQETQFGPTGPAADAKYNNILARLNSGQNVSDDEISFAKGHELGSRKTTTQSDTLGVTSSNTSGLSGLAAASRAKFGGGATAVVAGAGPSQPAAASAKDSIVDMIGNYKLNPTMLQRMVVKHPDVLASVSQKYPDFDQTTYNAKNKIISGYTSGSQSKEINAINTVMGHLSALDDAGTALKNGNVQVINKIANGIGVQIGETPATTYKMILHRVGPELATAYIAGGGGEAERQSIAQDFGDNLSPDQIHANTAKSVELLRSKIGSLENQYKNSVGRDDFQQRFITPDAQKALQKFAPQGGSSSQQKYQVGQKVPIKGKGTMTITAVHPDGSFDAQ